MTRFQAMWSAIRYRKWHRIATFAGILVFALIGVFTATVSIGRWYVASKTSDWIELLKSADAAQRRHAALMLNELAPPTPEVQRALVRALGDESAEVRQQASAALSKFVVDRDTIVPALKTALGDQDVYVRANAARTLGVVSPADADVMTALEHAESDADDYVRSQAREARRKLAARAR